MSEPINPKGIRSQTPDWQEGYDAGYDAGLKVSKSSYNAGYKAGKKYARGKVHDLLTEVIEAYEKIESSDKDASDEVKDIYVKSQINAVKFARKWVSSGGDYTLDGDRACFPW